MSQQNVEIVRIAYNEDWCRDLNERKTQWMKSGHPGDVAEKLA